MCIIVVKNKGVEMPKLEILKNCFENNSDGCGMMYHKDNKVYIEKGFMFWSDFEKRIKKLEYEIDTKKEGIIFHFRIGTAGSNSAKNTHPYVISSKYNLLHKTKLVANLGVAHNGILNKYNPTPQEIKMDINDTQKFIANVLNYFKKQHGINFIKNKTVVSIVENLIDTNKLAFLNNNNEIVTIGDFIEENGILYSNTSYNKSIYSYYDFNNYVECSLLNEERDKKTREEITDFLSNTEINALKNEFYTTKEYKNMYIDFEDFAWDYINEYVIDFIK